jgi:tRNA(Arg) A34 adenosine deaminase TadA
MMNIEKYMQEAIRLSKESIQAGGGPFGAVIVKDGHIIGRGQNAVVNSFDPTAHAEIVAIRQACLSIHSHDLTGAIIYTSCEPCPMCLAAIWWSRIQKIYYGNTREDATNIGFDDAIIYEELAKPLVERKLVIQQLLHAEALTAFDDWENYDQKCSY